MRRRGSVALLLAFIAGSVAAFPVRAANTDSAAPRFVDGEWEGALDYTGAANVAGGFSLADVLGTFTLVASAGTASGTFRYLGQSTGSIQGGEGDIQFGGEGSIADDVTRPVFTITRSGITGEVTYQGFTSPIEIDTTSQFSAFPLHIAAATCTQVSGSFSQEAEAALNAAGTAVVTEGYFSAVRKQDAAPGTVDTINALLNQLDSMLAAALDGTANPNDILATVKKAEDAAASLPSNVKCGLVKKPDMFMLAISTRMAAFLDLAITDPATFSTNDLVELMWIGVEVGAIGKGAADQGFSTKILGNLEDILTDRLQAALTAKDAAAIEDIKIAAITFGFHDLEELATK